LQQKLPLVEPTDPHLPAARELSTASKLRVRIGFWKKNWKPTLDEARHAAAEIARRDDLHATEADIEDAANLYIFTRAIRDCDLAVSEPLAHHAFQTMRDDPTHTLVHRDWVQLLLQSHRPDSADTAALAYLEYIQQWDQADPRTHNALALWARLLQTNPTTLPKSIAYFAATFPDLNPDKP
jgi:hypothetical protein